MAAGKTEIKSRLDLAERCLRDGEAHLVEVSLSDFESYAFGYDSGRGAYGQTMLPPGYHHQAAEMRFRSMILNPDSWLTNNGYSSFLKIKHAVATPSPNGFRSAGKDIACPGAATNGGVRKCGTDPWLGREPPMASGWQLSDA